MEKDIIKKKLKDGREYTIRKDRRRYFYPSEWDKFYNSVKKPVFDFLINTGARIDESFYIRPMDFDFIRNNVRIWKTKTKAKKGEKFGKTRTISISSIYAKRVKKLCKNKEKYLFKGTIQGINQLLKRRLKKIGIEDYYNFSTHNIRKTHGMWLKAIGVDSGEICIRLGHDMDTYLNHYGSADIFNNIDVRRIEEFFGDLYQRKRRY